MSRMSDIHLELSEMTTEELEQAYVALKYSPSKSVRDEVMQEMMAQMLNQREAEDCSPFATINS
jgi:hypothetical protein